MIRRLLRIRNLRGQEILPLLLILCLLVSCKKDVPSPNTTDQERTLWQGGIDSVLAQGGELIQGKLRQFEPKENKEDLTLGGKPIIEHKTKDSPQVVSPGYYRKVRRTFSYLGYSQEGDYISDLRGEVVWPGNLIYVRSLQTQHIEGLSELNEYRTPGKVSMAVVNGGKNLTRVLSDYRFSEVNKQLNDLVASNTEELPAHLEYSIQTVRTLGEAAYYLRVSEDELKRGEKYKEIRSVRWHENTLKAIITFSQRFFTLVYDDPDGGASGLFTTGLTAQRLGRYTGPTNPLGFVSSVSYGRRFVAVIEETRRTYSDSTAFRARIEQSLPDNEQIQNLGRKVLGQVAPDKSQDIRNVRIYLRLEGGKDIFQTEVSTMPTMAELNKFLSSTASGANARYGVPISCTIKYLRSLRTVVIPRRIEGTYSYEDYEPEEDDNSISLSGLRLEGRLIDEAPRAYHNHYNAIHGSDCHIETVEVGYSLDGSKEVTRQLLGGQVRSFMNGGFDIPISSLYLATFGKSPKGYIRLSVRGQYHVQRIKTGVFPKRSGWSEVPFSRNVYLRYDPQGHRWYVDSDGRGAGDQDFQLLRTYLDSQHCGVELKLHYRVQTEQRGPLPHRDLP